MPRICARASQARLIRYSAADGEGSGMRRGLFLLVAFLCATGPALGKNLDAEVMVQPESPIRVVGCSVDLHELRNGQNFSAKGSFEDIGPKTATAVRIGFAFFDALG